MRCKSKTADTSSARFFQEKCVFWWQVSAKTGVFFLKETFRLCLLWPLVFLFAVYVELVLQFVFLSYSSFFLPHTSSSLPSRGLDLLYCLKALTTKSAVIFPCFVDPEVFFQTSEIVFQLMTMETLTRVSSVIYL